MVERDSEGFSVDSALIGDLLDIPPASAQALMREGTITSCYERGEDEHAGQHRLTFFYKGRRARLTIDGQGRIVRRSVINLGEPPVP